jgi:hypothetical protein
VGLERGPSGRREQDPEGRIPLALRRSTDRRQARRGASRREGNQTLRAEGAGAWNPRVIRILLAGMCRRGKNPRRAVPPSLRAWGGDQGTRHFRGEPTTCSVLKCALAYV